MKASKVSFAFIAALTTWTLLLSACAQNKDDSSANDAKARNVSTTVVPTGAGIQLTAQSYSLSGTQMDSQTFEENVKNFLAAFWNPEGVGTISQNSVVFAMNLNYSPTGLIIPTTSKMRLWVTDSYAAEKTDLGNGKTAQPYEIGFDSTSGTITGNKSASQISATFRDGYQEVTINANLSNGSYFGTVSFRNLKDATQSQLKSAQPMGYFRASVGSF